MSPNDLQIPIFVQILSLPLYPKEFLLIPYLVKNPITKHSVPIIPFTEHLLRLRHCTTP